MSRPDGPVSTGLEELAVGSVFGAERSRSVLSSATTPLLSALLYAFEPGRPISLYEAQMALRDDYGHAEATLAALTQAGELDLPSPGLWVRSGRTPNAYLLGARVTYPYTFVGETALALHGTPKKPPREIWICSQEGFAEFEYAGITYRPAGEWTDEGISRALVGGEPAHGWLTEPLGLLSTSEPVAVTTIERTLVDCVRDPIHGPRPEEVVAALAKPQLIEPRGILRALDRTEDPQLPGRVALLLELLGVGHRQPDLMRAVRSRSGVIGRRRS